MLCIVVNSENLDFYIKIMLAVDHDSYIKIQVIRLYIHMHSYLNMLIYIYIYMCSILMQKPESSCVIS